MNDPVIARIRREDPAAALRSSTGDEMLARVRRELAGAHPAPARMPTRGRIGGVVVPVAAGLVTIVVVAAAIGLLGHVTGVSSSSGRHTPPIRAVPAGSAQVATGVETLLADGQSLWVAGGVSLERLDPSDGAAQAAVRLPLEGLADAIAVGAGSVWVASGGGNTAGAPSLVRIDPKQNRILGTIEVTGSPAGPMRVLNGGLAFAAGRVWLTRDSTGSHGDVVSVNPATNRLDGRPVLVGTGPTRLLSAFGALWVENTGRTVGLKPARPLPASVSRIDPRTRAVQTEPFAGAPSAGFGSLWVSDSDTVTRYDSATGHAAARLRVPGVIALAVGDGRVWALSRSASGSDQPGASAMLTQIDPRSNRTVGAPRPLRSSQPVAIAVHGHDLWIAGYDGRLLHFKLTP